MNNVPALKTVEVKTSTTIHGEFSVQPIWEGVDRPNTGGWIISTMALAKRLAKAIKAGVVCTNTHIAIDVNGKTYVQYDSDIYSRELDTELTKLGF